MSTAHKAKSAGLLSALIVSRAIGTASDPEGNGESDADAPRGSVSDSLCNTLGEQHYLHDNK